MLGGGFESDLSHTIEAGLGLTLEGSRIKHSLLISRGVAIPKENAVRCAEVKCDVSRVLQSLQWTSTGTCQSKRGFRTSNGHQAVLAGDTCLGNSVFEVYPVCIMLMMMLLNS